MLEEYQPVCAFPFFFFAVFSIGADDGRGGLTVI